MLDRRKEHRAISMFKSAYVRDSSGLHFVTLRNISETGICFDTYCGVAEGTEIEFCFDATGPKTGIVKWVQDGRFGVSASPGSIILQGLTGQKPRAVRLPLSIKARVFVEGRCSEVTIHNLSLRGVCIDYVHGMRVGQLVSVELGNRCFELATIRWHDSNRVGICFAEPIMRNDFRMIVEKTQESLAA